MTGRQLAVFSVGWGLLCVGAILGLRRSGVGLAVPISTDTMIKIVPVVNALVLLLVAAPILLAARRWWRRRRGIRRTAG